MDVFCCGWGGVGRVVRSCASSGVNGELRQIEVIMLSDGNHTGA